MRGTLFTVQKALPLFNHGKSILMTGSNAAAKGFPGFGVYAASKLALRSFARTWLKRTEGEKSPHKSVGPGAIATPIQESVLTPEANQYFEFLLRAEPWPNLKKLRQLRCFSLPAIRAS